MRKIARSGRTRRNFKLAPPKASKPHKGVNTVVTLEAGNPSAQNAQESFTDCAHLRQVVCLLPSNNPALAKRADKPKESSSDDDLVSEGK